MAPAVAGTPPYFWDVPSSHWAADAIARLWSSGVVKGGPDQGFRPDDPVTRAEFVKMLLLSDGIAAGSECAGTFTDVPCAHWAAPYVETAYRIWTSVRSNTARTASVSVRRIPCLPSLPR